MAGQVTSTHVPCFASCIYLVVHLLLPAGVRIGPDALLTVRGRRNGLPRSTPLTLCERLGRRGLVRAFGETGWARNLRAAGEATIRRGRRKETVTAIELAPSEAAEFIRDVISASARRTWIGGWIARHIDEIDIDHPIETAHGRPVFELRRR
jgi:deazaflavin-dependent oxidoreductase (nitroreductase family)